MVDDEDWPGGYLGGWFGESWGAEVCRDGRHLPTPVGELCLFCEKTFTADDQGLTIPGVKDGLVDLRSAHIACLLQNIGVDDD